MLIQKIFIECSNDMQDVYKNIEVYNADRERKILIVFDDIIADMINNKKLNSIVTEFFIIGRKLNIFLVLLHNYILRFQNVLDQILLTVLSWKFRIKENFNKFH